MSFNVDYVFLTDVSQFPPAQHRQCYVLGDSAYPLRTWLMTPLDNPGTEQERRYQLSQTSTRSVVERTFGIMKRRFPGLHSGLRYQPDRAARYIMACAVLHNMAVQLREPLEEFVDEPRHGNPDQDEADDWGGQNVRDVLLRTVFA